MGSKTAHAPPQRHHGIVPSTIFKTLPSRWVPVFNEALVPTGMEGIIRIQRGVVEGAREAPSIERSVTGNSFLASEHSLAPR
ncbi:hypothetical protein NPIL_161471 [Nephila pilipes]|uniref:Uncharacterized protein n=1 Tax=Nephila pilipes TaxID=299642 RepID=A0A8X6QZJ8_NEPPI|nr:hypothetical protein NPIL_161471 [Nephila pilipes]